MSVGWCIWARWIESCCVLVNSSLYWCFAILKKYWILLCTCQSCCVFISCLCFLVWTSYPILTDSRTKSMVLAQFVLSFKISFLFLNGLFVRYLPHFFWFFSSDSCNRATEEGMLSVFLKAVLFVPSPNYGCLASLACCSYHYGSPTSLACCEFGMFMMGAGASLWLLVKLVKYCITLVVITVIAIVLHL